MKVKINSASQNSIDCNERGRTMNNTAALNNLNNHAIQNNTNDNEGGIRMIKGIQNIKAALQEQINNNPAMNGERIIPTITDGHEPVIGEIVGKPESMADQSDINHENKRVMRENGRLARRAAKEQRKQEELQREQQRAERNAARAEQREQDKDLNETKPMLEADEEFCIGKYSVAYVNGDDNTVRCKMFDTRIEAEAAAEKVLKPVAGKPTRKWSTQIRYYGIGQTIVIEDVTFSNDDRATLAQFDEVFVKKVTNTVPVTVLTLNEKYGHSIGQQPDVWVRSTVLKRLSPLEERIIELGGDNAYIRVITNIPEYSGTGAAAEDIAYIKQCIVDDAVDNGIQLFDKTFVPLGHTTNGAKDNTTIWVDRKIWAKLWCSLYGEVASDWLTTPAKQIAYLVGLQAVKVEYINLPVIPEDVEYFPSLFKTVKDNVLWVGKDKTVTLCKDKDVEQNTFDGQTIMSFTENIRNAFALRRAASTGESYDYARACVDREIEELPKAFSMRVNGAADKGAVLVYKHGEYQDAVRRAWEEKHPGEECIIHQKDPDSILMWCDNTVLKTSISPKSGAAFHSKEEWNDAVRGGFAIGILIREHEDQLKDSSYQLTELLYGASDESLAQLARYEANYLKTLLTERGIKTLVGGTRAKLAEIIPSFATERHFRKDADMAYKRILIEMGEGKVHHHSHYALAFADPVAMAQWHAGWDADEVTGVIAPKTIVITSAEVSGEGIAWRHPLLNIGAVLVVNIINTAPEGYEGIFNETTSMFFSILDASATRMRADFDGDHTNWSMLKPLIKGIKETKEKYGDYLVDFEAPEAAKMIVDSKERTKYFKSLVQQNELGKNCYDLARVYGMTPDEEWLATHPMVSLPAEIYQGFVPQDTAARKDRDANVNVDKGKHGGDADDKTNPDFWARGLLLPCGVILHGMQKDAEFKALSDEDKIERLLNVIKAECNYTGNGAIDKYVNMVRHTVPMELPVVEDEFDYKVLMSSTEIGYRGLSGLFRKGSYDAKRRFNPTQGLFQNVALRSASEWQQITEGESDKLRRMDHHAFENLVRNQSLAEFDHFAESAGRSLDDACDVITAKMFQEWDKMYGSDNAFGPMLWKEYWTDFGDMLIANAEANTDVSDILEDKAMYNVVMVRFGSGKLYTYLTEDRVNNGQQVIVETFDGNRIVEVVHSGTRSWCDLARYAAENGFTEYKWAVPVA